MLKIRLTRTGRKNLSNFRVVVAEHKAPIKGRFIEIIGSFNPHIEKGLVINKDRLDYWMKNGAKPTDTVNNLLVDAKIFDAKNVIKKTSKKKVKEKEEKPEKPEVIESPAAPQAQEGSAMEMAEEPAAKEEEAPKEDAKEEVKEENPEAAPKTEGKEETAK